MSKILFLLLILFAIDRLMLYLESKGHVYWRKSKKRPKGITAGLLNASFDAFTPNASYAVEEKQRLKHAIQANKNNAKR